MIAAFAALATVIIGTWSTRDAVTATRLDNAPALYLACSQRATLKADIFYPIADVNDYPGAYLESNRLTLFCSITNVSRRPLVNIRFGFRALFYDRQTLGPENVIPYVENLVLPDDGPPAVTSLRPQTINLAPNAKITMVLPNVSYHRLLIDPNDRAEAHFPGDDKAECADVYLAPGTARALEQLPMDKLPEPKENVTPGFIPSPPPSECLDFDTHKSATLSSQGQNATPVPQVWIPAVTRTFNANTKGNSAEVELTHQ
jgi:hypothetical protein